MAKKPNPDQGALVIIAEQSGQMYVPQEYYDQETASSAGGHVSLIGHYIHLQNTVTYMSEHSMLQGLIYRDNQDIKQNRTHMSPQYRTNTINRIGTVASQVEQSFNSASGSSTLIAPKLFTEAKVGREGFLDSQLLLKFWFRYYGPLHHKEAQTERGKWENNARVLQREQHTKYNQVNQLRPHIVEESVVRVKKTEDELKLDTRRRLKAIIEDPRAGYIPTNNREKNQVLAFLDYMDNPNYPFGINNQFLEVFTHSQTLRRKNKSIDSKRGPVSITYELGDYLANAVAQRAALEELELLLVDSVNLGVTVADESDFIDPKHSGFAALLRFRDLRQFMETGEAVLRNDPLLSKEDRWEEDRSVPGKHKIVEDRYTGAKRPKVMTRAINKATLAMTIGEARSLIVPAIRDQISRESLLRQLVGEIATPVDDMRGKAREVLVPASEAAHDVLEELKAA